MVEKLVLPNIRKLFIPDVGYTIFDVDLSGADAQVVAWEAEDEDLKNAFRAGVDIHVKNATDMWGSAFTHLEGVAFAKKRKQCKQAVHLTNYGGSATAAAKVLGWTNHEADTFQKRWFSLHPKIKSNFHGKVQKALLSTKTVTNGFGYRRVFFDRADNLLPEALAWIPQSTVALVSFFGALSLEQKCPYVQMLLQVHDSLVFQVPKSQRENVQLFRLALATPVPYLDPLTIQWGVARSDRSWGDCEKVEVG